MYNWLQAVKSSELNPESTSFKLFLAAKRQGKIANSFSEANTLELAKEMWKQAKNEFYDENDNEKKLSDEYKLYIKEFFSPTNMLSACKIILKFSLITIEKNHTTVLYNIFRQKVLIHEDLMENVFVFMLGWIDKKTAELVESGKPMSVSFNEYKAQLIAITREFNQNLSLKEIAPRPTEEEIQYEYNAVRSTLSN
ncbi:hypothetical protein N752_28110 [Desulforamulus aquiferis]|nr:hypothetical protein [Desulforamulus aquiferis]RYD01839.1 hypothetical protein N752_28110 [Desulforamulus aquiferis]